MKCEEARRLRDAYLDQVLTEEETLAFEAHAAECEACWQELVELRDLGFDLDAPELQQLVMNEPMPLPVDFTEQVMARVEAERPRGINVVWPWIRRKWSHRQVASVAYAMSATAVVVSAGEFLYVWNKSSDTVALMAVKGQAYMEAANAYFGGMSAYIAAAWQWITQLM